MWSRGTIRSASALIMLAYVICHFADHMTLLISIPFADAAHHILIDPWRSTPGTALLLTALAAHYGNALWSIYMRRSLLLPRWQWWQLWLGISIPPVLLLHVVSTRLSEIALGVVSDYSSVLLRLWVLAAWNGFAQVAFLTVVWAHAMLGLNFWLRTKRWYARWRTAFGVFALLWPVLALAGYVAGGNELLRAARQPGFVAAEEARAHISAATIGWALHLTIALVALHFTLVGLAFAARRARVWAERRQQSPLLTHAGGRTLRVPPGATILETLSEHGIRHASVCGGRARCTTCRVRVLSGAGALPAPSALEAAALARIGAPADCRLACQTRPVADLSIVPLLPPSARPVDGHGHAGFEGTEQLVTVMFVDLRGSTRLGEARLPYDVLFLLDQFFLEMSTALAACGGHFSQFTGDGLMALFGLHASENGATARAAMACALDMQARLARLNARLVPDLAEPLRIGIGIHHGEAIVGPLGPPGSQILTAIGDTVNTTARLEGLSKLHGDAIIISQRAAAAAGFDLSGEEIHETLVSGRVEPVRYYARRAGAP